MSGQSEAPFVIRAFIAVNISKNARIALTDVICSLRRSEAHVSWVRPENLHISLVFLGDTFRQTLDEIAADLCDASLQAPFRIEVGGLGTFGRPRSPRVVWAGVSGSGDIEALQSRVTTVCSQHGFMPEQRPYRPHVTLGRVRSNRNIGLLMDALKEREDTRFGATLVERVDCMRSERLPTGVRYHAEHSIPLPAP